MDSVDIIFPDHEDILIYEKKYGYWDIDLDQIKKDVETYDPLPDSHGRIHELYDKIVTAGEYVPLHNEEECLHFIDVAKGLSEELELDIIIIQRARCIDAIFTLPFGPCIEILKPLNELLNIAHEVNLAPMQENFYNYTAMFSIRTEEYRRI